MTQTKITRRRFLQLTGMTLGAGALACSGLTVLGTRPPEIKFTETHYGDNAVSKKILVAYASKAGATAGVAEAIGKTLAESGAYVDVRQMKQVTDLSPYQAVVAGSAIRAGKWLPEAMQFVRTHQSKLSQMPTAYFLVCLTMAKDTEASRQTVTAYLEPVRTLVKPVAEGLFGGALWFDKLPLIPDGLIIRAVAASSQTPEGDYRNWDAIRAWTDSARPRLLQ